HLAQDPARKPSFAVVMPVSGLDGHLVGDTAAVIGIAPLANTALARAGLLADRDILLRMYAGRGPAPGNLTWSDHDPARSGKLAAPLRWLSGSYSGRSLHTFTVAGQEWTVEALAAGRPWLADHLARSEER